MPPTATFSPQLLGQTENALNAILIRELRGTGVSEPQWVTLRVTAMAGGALGRPALVARVADALKVAPAEAEGHVAALTAMGHLEDADGGAVRLTDAGRALLERVGARVAEITRRIWGDLPEEDLATAGAVLAAVLDRANAALADV